LAYLPSRHTHRPNFACAFVKANTMLITVRDNNVDQALRALKKEAAA
jgi:hypothetical protein